MSMAREQIIPAFSIIVIIKNMIICIYANIVNYLIMVSKFLSASLYSNFVCYLLVRKRANTK